MRRPRGLAKRVPAHYFIFFEFLECCYVAWGPIAADAGPLLHILGGDRLCGLGLPFTAVAGSLLHIPGKFCCVARGRQFRRRRLLRLVLPPLYPLGGFYCVAWD